ncbi:MAG: TolC family protein [Firmicutes bacterium]|nr:TolC family protein [Bacillota bacterium]
MNISKRIMATSIIKWCSISLLFIVFISKYAWADSLMDIFKASANNSPAIKALNYQEQSLLNEQLALDKKRFSNYSAGLSHSNISSRLAGQYTISDIDFFGTFDIFDKTRFEREKKYYDIYMTKLKINIERKKLFSAVSDNYFNLVRNKMLISMREENLKWLDKGITLVKQGIKKGIFPGVELNRWEIEKLNESSLIESYRSEEKKAEQSLMLLTGRQSLNISYPDKIGVICLSEPDYIKHSPELYAFDASRKKFEVDIESEQKGWYPDLQVGNSYELNRDPTANGNLYTIYANLNFHFPDGGKRYRIQSLKDSIAGLELEYKNTEIALLDTYRNTLIEIQSGRELIKSLNQAVEVSDDTLKKQMKGYEKQVIDFMALINTFREYLAAREGLINNTTKLNRNYWYLYHLTEGDIYQ